MHSQTTRPNKPKNCTQAIIAKIPTTGITAAIRVLYLFFGLLAPVSAFAQGTVMPIPLAQWFDNNGDVLADGGFCVFEAGSSSTLATTYTTAALSVANANPIEFNSAGRATTGGVFLRPGNSYKFVLKDFTGVVSPTCVPDSGVTLWTVDNVMAVPSDSGVLEISDAIAGETLSAGDAVYLSDGQGGRTQGRWYKTDADLTYASSEAPFVGMAPAAITSGATGTVRVQGQIDLAGPLTTAGPYFLSGTAGAITAAAPTNVRVIGTAQSTTLLLIAPFNSYRIPSLNSANILSAIQLADIVDGRCSLTSAVPVTTSDVTAATTLYWALYRGNSIGLYTGTNWVVSSLAELSIAVPATTAQMYDVFVDYNDGTPQLALTAWTNDTTRATALTTQNGVYVKTGDTQQRYVCSFRTTGVSGQTEDSFAKRYVWNYYNRVPRAMRVLEGTNTWASGAGWRYMNNSAANRLECVIGVAEVMVEADVTGFGFVDAGGGYMSVAVGYDTAAGPTTGNVGMTTWTPNNGGGYPMRATLQHYPAVGFHFYGALENAVTGASTWYGDNGTTTMQAGISGWVEG